MMWQGLCRQSNLLRRVVGIGSGLPRLIHLLLFCLCMGFGLAWDQTPALAADPVLSIANATKSVFNNTTFTVPVTFAANSNNIASVSFSLDMDQNCLTFDSITDSNGDGIPNAVTGLPSALLFVSTVAYSASDTDGEIDISIYDTLLPLGPLSSGTLVTLEFGIKSSCRTTNGTQPAISFPFSSAPNPSFSGLLGFPISGSATGGTITLRFNANPTDIGLSGATVNENLAKNTSIGTLSSTDIDTNLSPTPDSHTYSLVSGIGATNNLSFTVAGTNLQTNAIFNYEAQSTYSIRLRTTDSYGGTYEESMTITIGNVNEAPTSLSLTSSTVAENLGSGVTIGTFATADQDVGATATYAFVAGAGDTANSAFTLTGSTLQTNLTFSYEISPTQNIRVRVTDNGGLTFDNIFTINITNTNDAPIAVNDSISPTIVAGPVTLDVRANDTDEDGDALTITAVGAAISGTTSYSATAVTYTPSANYNGVVTFSYTISDSHSVGARTDSGDVVLQVVANKARGDCNGDGLINAGDFSAIILEEVDNDGTPNHWYNSYLGDFAGYPLGCDANASETINIADLTCSVLIFFGDSTCTTALVAAAQAIASSVATLGMGVADADNHLVTIPLDLQTNGQPIAAASFTLAWDPQQLALDPADADSDGVPDAVTLHLPDGMTSLVTHDATTGRLDLTVFAVRVPMPLLPAGRLADITVQIASAIAVDEIPIALTQGSLGSDQGQSVPVQVVGGLIRRMPLPYHLFLPTVVQ